MIDWPSKAPGAVEDFEFDWSGELEAAETITSKTVSAVGVTVNSSAIDAGKVRVWLSGGAEGTVATVTASIVTSGGRTYDEVAVLPIGASPVSLGRAKQHLRVEDDAEDSLIWSYVMAAVDQVEAITSKNLTPKVARQRVRGFPFNGAIKFHRGPVQDVVRIEYDPSDGSAAVELADYRLIEGPQGALLPLAGASWPSTYDGPGTVRIDYLAGFAPGEMPKSLERAVLELVEFYFSNRGGGDVPSSVMALCNPYRSIGLG